MRTKTAASKIYDNAAFDAEPQGSASVNHSAQSAESASIAQDYPKPLHCGRIVAAAAVFHLKSHVIVRFRHIAS